MLFRTLCLKLCFRPQSKNDFLPVSAPHPSPCAPLHPAFPVKAPFTLYGKDLLPGTRGGPVVVSTLFTKPTSLPHKCLPLSVCSTNICLKVGKKWMNERRTEEEKRPTTTHLRSAIKNYTCFTTNGFSIMPNAEGISEITQDQVWMLTSSWRKFR